MDFFLSKLELDPKSLATTGEIINKRVLPIDSFFKNLRIDRYPYLLQYWYTPTTSSLKSCFLKSKKELYEPYWSDSATVLTYGQQIFQEDGSTMAQVI